MTEALRVFLSSSLDDEMVPIRKLLKAKIADRLAVILEYGEAATGAKSDSPRRASLKKLRLCQIVVLLIGEKIGPVTAQEWREAVRRKQRCLVYFADYHDDESKLRIVNEVFSKPGFSKKGHQDFGAIDGTFNSFMQGEAGALNIVLDLQAEVQEHFPQQNSPLTKRDSLIEEFRNYCLALGWIPEKICDDPAGWSEIIVAANNSRQLVRCQEGLIGGQDISELADRSRQLNCSSFRLIANNFAAELRAEAKQLCGQLQHMNDFLLEILDIEDDFKDVENLVQSLDLGAQYIELDCTVRIDYGEGISSSTLRGELKKHVKEWLNENQRHQLAVLGDFGSGKSWFCLELCREFINKVRLGESVRLPILVKLGKLAPKQGDQLDLKSSLTSMLGIADKSRSLLNHLLDYGRLMIVLDGFDELGRYVDPVQMGGFREQIARLSQGRNKVLLTSRRAYFSNAESEREGLNESPKTSDSVEFQIVYLKDLNTRQIEKKVEKRFGALSGKYIKKINSDPNLARLAVQPIVLDMLLNIIQGISEDESLTLYKIYDICTRNWLKQAARPQSPMTEDSRRDLMSELAWNFYIENVHDIDERQLGDVVDKLIEQIDDTIDVDIEGATRSETLLVRDGYGRYSFAHRSFMEFFAAHKLYREYRENRPDLFGVTHITNEVATFLIDNNIDTSKLLAWLHNESNNRMEWFAGNILTLLHKMSFDFSGQDFSGLAIKQANLAEAVLAGVSFNGANLDGVIFSGADLSYVDFRNAKLLNLILGVKSSAKAIASTSDSDLVVGTSAKNEILKISSVGSEQVIALGKHKDSITYLRFSRDNSKLASVGFDQVLKLWDVPSGSLIRVIPLAPCTSYAVGLLQDYDVLLTGGNDNLVHAYRISDGSELASWHKHGDAIYCIATDSKNQRFATASFDNSICVWTLDEPKLGFTLREWEILSGHETLVNGVAFQRDGSELASCDNDGWLHVRKWNGSRWSRARKILAHKQQVWSVQFSPDGKYAVTGSTDRTIAVWSCHNEWQEVARLRGHTGAIWNVVFDHTGETVISSSWDSTIRVWDWRSGKQRRKISTGVQQDMGLVCKGIKITNSDGLSPLQEEFLIDLGAT